MSMNTSQYIWDSTNNEWVKARGTASGDIAVSSAPNFVGTAAECQTQADLLDTTDVGVYTFFATDTNQYGTLSAYSASTGTITWETTAGAAHVRPLPGPQTQSRNRNLVAVADAHPGDDTTNTVTWPEAANITEVTIFPTIDAGTSTDTTVGYAPFVIVAVNATDATEAALWLDPAADSATDDVQFYKIPIGEPTVLRFTDPVLRLDFEVHDADYATNTTDIWIGAN